jgi:hypothetical protein
VTGAFKVGNECPFKQLYSNSIWTLVSGLVSSLMDRLPHGAQARSKRSTGSLLLKGFRASYIRRCPDAPLTGQNGDPLHGRP